VLILKGEGKHFTAGLDMQSAAGISTMGYGPDESNEDADSARKAIRMSETLKTLQRYVSSFENCRVPVICAMSGYCIGAGIDIASACDIRMCAKDTKFTIKEVDLALAADFGTL